MIKNPPILFINCIGSYYYSLLTHLNHDKKNNELLLYLVHGKLKYRALDEEEIQIKHHNNSWGYQPIGVEEQSQNQIRIDDKFYEFLEDKFSLKICKENVKTERNLEFRLIENCNNHFFSIVNVDEFYIPTSKKSYGKNHNKHSLVILDLDSDLDMIILMDSEENHSIMIPIQAFKDSIYKSEYKNHYLYTADTSEFSHTNIEPNLVNGVLLNFLDYQFIDYMLQDLKEKLQLENCTYYYQGYYYNILSKIIPYLSMVQFVLTNSEIGFHEDLAELIREWQALCNFMHIKLVKRSIQFDFIKDKLKIIKMKYKDVTENLYLYCGGRNEWEFTRSK